LVFLSKHVILQVDTDLKHAIEKKIDYLMFVRRGREMKWKKENSIHQKVRLFSGGRMTYSHSATYEMNNPQEKHRITEKQDIRWIAGGAKKTQDQHTERVPVLQDAHGKSCPGQNKSHRTLPGPRRVPQGHKTGPAAAVTVRSKNNLNEAGGRRVDSAGTHRRLRLCALTWLDRAAR
jgi:hypothetical protein